jgi:hypothetical protein
MDQGIDDQVRHLRKRRPRGATQHASAGSYSPVLQVDARHLPEGTVVQCLLLLSSPVEIEMWAVAAKGS